MLYIVKWADVVGPRPETRFATWDGRVTDASPVIGWLVGERVESAIRTLQTKYGGRVVLVDGSWNIFRIGKQTND